LEQVEQSPDNWKEGQLLSAKVLCNEGYDSMDVNDSRIAMQLTRKEEWQTDADIIVPNLVGTDRLFYGVEYLPDRILARIVNEDPYIEFSGQGDQIVISGGKIYVNGEVYNDILVRDAISEPGLAANEITLGEDEYFVLGDNRNNSKDSRHPELGPVDTRYVIGRAVCLLMPGRDAKSEVRDWSRIGGID
jgi:hypothetical protein